MKKLLFTLLIFLSCSFVLTSLKPATTYYGFCTANGEGELWYVSSVIPLTDGEVSDFGFDDRKKVINAWIVRLDEAVGKEGHNNHDLTYYGLLRKKFETRKDAEAYRNEKILHTNGTAKKITFDY